MDDTPASEQIDNIIKTHGGWKGAVLARLRAVIRQAAPDIVEEIKWKTRSRPEGLPVWSHNGIVCFAETWKDNIKLVFFYGAKLADPHQLFNARLMSSTVRAIELREGEGIDEAALQQLVREAVQLNSSK